MAAARPGELEPIPGTAALWAELRWAARAEAVAHLDDLLRGMIRKVEWAGDGWRWKWAGVLGGTAVLLWAGWLVWRRADVKGSCRVV